MRCAVTIGCDTRRAPAWKSWESSIPKHALLPFVLPPLTHCQVRDEQAEAQSVAVTVSAEEAEVAAQAARCKALKDDAAADLVGCAVI